MSRPSPEVDAEVNAVLDHAERVNEVAERYKAEAERYRQEVERTRSELAWERSRRGGDPDSDRRAYEVAERYARLSEDSLRMLHSEREARRRAEEYQGPSFALAPALPPPMMMSAPMISAPILPPPPVMNPPMVTAPMNPPMMAPDRYDDRSSVAEMENLLRGEREKVTFLMLEKDRLENLLEAEKQRHEYEEDIMHDELEYSGQQQRYWQWWSSEGRQELLQAQSAVGQLRSEAERLRLDLLDEREGRQRAERALEEYKIVAERTNMEIEARITRNAEEMVNNYRRVVDTLEKQLEVYRRQAMENEVKMRELTRNPEWHRSDSPRAEATPAQTFSHLPARPQQTETTTVTQYIRTESPVRAPLPPPAVTTTTHSTYFTEQLAQLRKERDEAYSALSRYEDPSRMTLSALSAPLLPPATSEIFNSRFSGYSPPRQSRSDDSTRRRSISPRRRMDEMTSRRIDAFPRVPIPRLSPTRL